MKHKRLLSLFSGCGGMDLGFEGGFETLYDSLPESLISATIPSRSGWVKVPKLHYSIVFANDIRSSAKLAWDNHFIKMGIPASVYKLGSIVDLVKAYYKGNFMFPNAIDIVTGGFPCQDFSLAGKRLGLKSNKNHLGKLIDDEAASIENRGNLYIWMKEVIEIVRPKMFIAENVKGLANLEDVRILIQKDFASAGDQGYLVIAPRILHAGRFGVPQMRERLIFMGFRKDALRSEALKELMSDDVNSKLNPYPIPSHSLTPHFEPLLPFVKTKMALQDLLEPDVELQVNAQKNYSKAKFLSPLLQGQTEIDLDGLAPTIRAEHHGNIEFRRLSLENGGRYYDELAAGKIERRLTVRECARLQTFPDNYHFVFSNTAGSVSASEAYKLIGNAVPPLLAFRIAQRIEEIWSSLFMED